ncbi:MAG: FitA-like ribbon-helix-helix domain-containing protein [Spirochaetia bacterium]
MPSITIKNIPEELYSALKKRAEGNHRSINGEILAVLERTIEPYPLDIQTVLERAANLRGLTSSAIINDDQIRYWKESGRL